MADVIDKAKLLDYLRSRVKDWVLYEALSRDAAMAVGGRFREAQEILATIECGTFDAPTLTVTSMPGRLYGTDPAAAYWVGEDE